MNISFDISTAQIGDTNKIKKFTVDFDSDRTIFSVEIISSETINVTNPNASFSGNTVTVTTDSILEGAKIYCKSNL